MNCANHPTNPVAAYCQNCGKPLCGECMRAVNGLIYCEPCLAARLGVPMAGQPAPEAGPFAPGAPNPALAALLGFIPGVGAMYNGQFVKALAHVLIFAVFIALADKSFVFGLLIAAWVFYQVFDAHQTAKARRDGLPLPNPFGLNDLGTMIGVQQRPGSTYRPGPGAQQPQPPAESGPRPAAGFTASAPPAEYAAWTQPGAQSGPAPFTSPYAPQQPSSYPAPDPALYPQRREPIGAILLIAIGLLLLFQTLGIFHGAWIDRSWPLIIVAVGAWLLYRRTRDLPPGSGPGGAQ